MKTPHVQFTVQLLFPEAEAIDNAAKAAGVSRSAFMKTALREYMVKQAPKNLESVEHGVVI